MLTPEEVPAGALEVGSVPALAIDPWDVAGAPWGRGSVGALPGAVLPEGAARRPGVIRAAPVATEP